MISYEKAVAVIPDKHSLYKGMLRNQYVPPP